MLSHMTGVFIGLSQWIHNINIGCNDTISNISKKSLIKDWICFSKKVRLTGEAGEVLFSIFMPQIHISLDFWGGD